MIKFLDLHKINGRFPSEMDASVKCLLDPGWYVFGKDLSSLRLTLPRTAA